MNVLGTMEVVERLRAEGFRISKSRLEGLVATGRVPAPGRVGPTRAWTEDDIDRVRRALVSLDGRPVSAREQGGEL